MSGKITKKTNECCMIYVGYFPASKIYLLLQFEFLKNVLPDEKDIPFSPVVSHTVYVAFV